MFSKVNFLALCILTGIGSNQIYGSMHAIKKAVKKELFDGFKLYADTVFLLNNRCLRNVEINDFVKQSLKSAISKIDPHSAFISDYNQMSDAISGNFSGIGVSILNKNTDEEQLLIIEVLEGSPAQKSGMLAGDKVIAVDGQSLRGMALDEVLSKMKGKRGTKVRLKILRNKKILEIEVIRDIIKDRSSLGYFFEEQKIYYVNLKTFSETAPKQMRDLIYKINKNDECKGLILDLRANSGGIMESAIDIASLFLPKKSLVVSTKNKNNILMGNYHTKDDPVLNKDCIIFILINNFTASAAEILAGALRFHAEEIDKTKNPAFRPLVFVLGTSTFGKGSVQEVIPLSNNCALKITTMLYFLPNGESIQSVGVKPDFLVLPTKSFSNEEKFLYELYGKEKSFKHHITSGEVADLVANKKLQKTTEVDRITNKKIERLEDEKNKSESSEKEDKEYDISDFGNLIDELENKAKSENDDNSSKIEVEEKRKKMLGNDGYIQTSVNMISYLDLLRRYEPKKTSTLSSCKKILQNSFVIGGSLKLKKID